MLGPVPLPGWILAAQARPMSLVLNTTAHAQDYKEVDAENWSAAHHAADAVTYCVRAVLALHQLIDATPAETLETRTTGSRAGGRTVLMLLAECGKDKCSEAASLMKQLVKKSPASRDITDLNGNTPLMQAVATGNDASAQVLVSLGSDVTAKNNLGMNSWNKAGTNPIVQEKLIPELKRVKPMSSWGRDPASLAAISKRQRIEGTSNGKGETGPRPQSELRHIVQKRQKERSLAFR